MKKIFTLFALAAMIILAACGGGQNAVSKDGLQGRYEIDLSGMTDEFEALLQGENNMSGTLLKMMLSQLDLTVQFDSDKATFDASAAASALVNTLSKGDLTLPASVDYKIERDSVIYFKREGKEFEEAGVLKKMGDSYDNLKFISNRKGKRAEINLKKVK
jgi:hypothetical protein